MLRLADLIIKNNTESIEQLENKLARCQSAIPYQFKGETISFGNTYPLHLTAYFGRPEIAKIFLDSGADVNAKDLDAQRTPLHYSAITNDIILAKFFLEHSVNVDIQDKKGLTALHYACMKNYVNFVKLLIDAHASINKQDKEGFTPLHICAIFNSPQCAAFLLNHHINAETKNTKNQTALDIAKIKNNFQMISILLRKTVYTDEELLKAPIERVDDFKNPELLNIEEKLKFDPWSRYTDPLGVLKELNSKSYYDLNLNESTKFPELIKQATGQPKTVEKKEKQKPKKITTGDLKKADAPKINLDDLDSMFLEDAAEEREKARNKNKNRKAPKQKPEDSKQTKSKQQANSTSQVHQMKVLVPENEKVTQGKTVEKVVVEKTDMEVKDNISTGKEIKLENIEQAQIEDDQSPKTQQYVKIPLDEYMEYVEYLRNKSKKLEAEKANLEAENARLKEQLELK